MVDEYIVHTSFACFLNVSWSICSRYRDIYLTTTSPTSFKSCLSLSVACAAEDDATADVDARDEDGLPFVAIAFNLALPFSFRAAIFSLSLSFLFSFAILNSSACLSPSILCNSAAAAAAFERSMMASISDVEAVTGLFKVGA